MMEIYAFGSLVRGEIDKFSDVDLLVIKEEHEQLSELDKEKYSIYTYHRISSLWNEGNPFAWHLFHESVCVFTNKGKPYIKSLGEPRKYNNLLSDLLKFQKLFVDSKDSIFSNRYSVDFDLSMIFLSIRNFASCFALGSLNKYEFSRDSALHLGQYSLELKKNVYDNLKLARLLATRGIGDITREHETDEIISEFPSIEEWFNSLINKAKDNGRVFE